MSLNRLYIGRGGTLNIGNGKTSSAVLDMLTAWAEEPDRPIYSNIKLIGVPYKTITPENLDEVLDTYDALVLLDELHAIVHKNHHITESCTKHVIKGLCYQLSEFYRQVRKRRIDTYSTCQTGADCAFQYWQLMNVHILCELQHLDESGGRWVACEPMKYARNECPKWHEHRVKQHWSIDPPWKYHYAYIQPIINNYDSYEIVKGWVSYD